MLTGFPPSTELTISAVSMKLVGCFISLCASVRLELRHRDVGTNPAGPGLCHQHVFPRLDNCRLLAVDGGSTETKRGDGSLRLCLLRRSFRSTQVSSDGRTPRCRQLQICFLVEARAIGCQLQGPSQVELHCTGSRDTPCPP